MDRQAFLRGRGAAPRTAIALGTAVLTAVVAAGCMLTTSGSPSVASEDSLSTQRPGYSPSPGLGDPVALVSEPGGAAVTYRGAPVVQACDLVTLDDLAAVGLTVTSGVSGGIERNYLDGQGDADLPLDPGRTLRSDIDDNNCYYRLGKDIADFSIEVQVHQPAYAQQRAISDELRYRHRRSADVGPVQVFEPVPPFTRGEGEGIAVWLRYRDMYVELDTSPMPDSQAQAVLATVAERLPAVAAKPTGPRRYSYRSPIFPVEYVNACEISTADDFRSLFRVEPSPSVYEIIGSGIGRIRFTANRVEANYVQHQCRWHTTETFTDSSSLVVMVNTYDSVDGATSEIEFNRLKGAGYGGDTPTRIGEESWAGLHPCPEVVDPATCSEAVLFRVGTVVGAVSLEDGPSRLTGDPYQALLPVATAIAARTPHHN